MGTRNTTETSEFGLAVRREILAELGRAQLNAYSLSKRIDRSANYLNKRIVHDDMELSLSDIEMICEALGIEITPLMERAELSMKHTEDFALAAKKRERGPEPSEEDYA